MKNLAFTLAALLCIGMTARVAVAQPEDRPIRKIEQFKKMKLLEVLDLDEATANAFLTKYDRWQKAIYFLSQRRLELGMQMKSAMEKKASDGELTALLDSAVDVSKRYEDAKLSMFVDLRSMLTPRQAVKLAAFEIQFQKKLHESIDKLRDRDREHWMDK